MLAKDSRVEKARAVDIVMTAKRLGAQLKHTGGEWRGPCPHCGGTDRFVITPAKGLFICRGGGEHAQGDIIEMVRHARACEFDEALELITGERREARQTRKTNGHAVPPPDEESPPWPQDEPRAATGGESEGRPLDDQERDERARWAALRGEPAHVYSYRDEADARRYEKLRYEWIQPSTGERTKTFLMRRPAMPGDRKDKIRDGWVYSVPLEGQRIPYNLAGLLEGIEAGETVLIPEGEKKVELLKSWGLTATCTDQGAGHWAPELCEYF